MADCRILHINLASFWDWYDAKKQETGISDGQINKRLGRHDWYVHSRRQHIPRSCNQGTFLSYCSIGACFEPDRDKMLAEIAAYDHLHPGTIVAYYIPEEAIKLMPYIIRKRHKESGLAFTTWTAMTGYKYVTVRDIANNTRPCSYQMYFNLRNLWGLTDDELIREAREARDSGEYSRPVTVSTVVRKDGKEVPRGKITYVDWKEQEARRETDDMQAIANIPPGAKLRIWFQEFSWVNEWTVTGVGKHVIHLQSDAGVAKMSIPFSRLWLKLQEKQRGDVSDGKGISATGT